MRENNFKYIYGPVSSWRLGSSLGIDPLSFSPKACSFDCIYCQIGKTSRRTKERKLYVETEEILKELHELPSVPIDYITFSGMGEPTLAKNLGEMLEAVKSARKEKIAVITNSSLLEREDVRKELLPANTVLAKIDACSEEMFRTINRPLEGIRLDSVLEGIKKFRKEYSGMLALQTMFIKENEESCEELSEMAGAIGFDEVQINTPLRPCPVKPLSEERISLIKNVFAGLNPITVFEKERKKTVPISSSETLRRRGKTT
jgi:wyosine [tRNA(Phe)-imidazoG37] synthetase (radical SAM superfamily)